MCLQTYRVGEQSSVLKNALDLSEDRSMVEDSRSHAWDNNSCLMMVLAKEMNNWREDGVKAEDDEFDEENRWFVEELNSMELIREEFDSYLHRNIDRLRCNISFH